MNQTNDFMLIYLDPVLYKISDESVYAIQK